MSSLRLPMKRTNTFAVHPLTDNGEQVLRDLLDASAALWNEINYQRLMRYNDEDGFEGEGVWDADTGRLEGTYKGVLGASTAQQVIGKNSEAWRGFFENKKKFHDERHVLERRRTQPLASRVREASWLPATDRDSVGTRERPASRSQADRAV
jgi:putative transposase